MPVVRHLWMAGRIEIPPLIDAVPVRVVAVLHEEEASLADGVGSRRGRPELVDGECDLRVEVRVLGIEVAETDALHADDSGGRVFVVDLVPLVRVSRSRVKCVP